ncbi:MAG: hypothetical protein IJT15_02435 [Rickettsiales bacterium]|nr:hypothetical protein [Rickettsiales bacterium]
MSIRNTLNGRTITRYNDNDVQKAQNIITEQKRQVDKKLQDRDNQLKTLIAQLDIINDIDGYDEARKDNTTRIQKYPKEKLLFYFPKKEKKILACYDDAGNIKDDDEKLNLQSVIKNAIFDEMKTYYDNGYDIDLKKWNDDKFHHKIVLSKSCKVYNGQIFDYHIGQSDKTIKDVIGDYVIKKEISYSDDDLKQICIYAINSDNNSEPLLTIKGNAITICDCWRDANGSSQYKWYQCDCEDEKNVSELQMIVAYLAQADLKQIETFCKNLTQNLNKINLDWRERRCSLFKVDTNNIIKSISNAIKGKIIQSNPQSQGDNVGDVNSIAKINLQTNGSKRKCCSCLW